MTWKVPIDPNVCSTPGAVVVAVAPSPKTHWYWTMPPRPSGSRLSFESAALKVTVSPGLATLPREPSAILATGGWFTHTFRVAWLLVSLGSSWMLATGATATRIVWLPEKPVPQVTSCPLASFGVTVMQAPTASGMFTGSTVLSIVWTTPICSRPSS